MKKLAKKKKSRVKDRHYAHKTELRSRVHKQKAGKEEEKKEKYYHALLPCIGLGLCPGTRFPYPYTVT